MNTQVIYEATNDFHLFSLPFIVICLILILLIVYIIKTWKNSKGIVGKILFLLIPIGLSVVVITQFADYFKVKQVFADFQKGNCKIAEGRIENYEQNYEVGTMAKEDYPDRFFVDVQNLLYTVMTHTALNTFCAKLTAVNYRKVNM